jgi:hypothetical protein
MGNVPWHEEFTDRMADLRRSGRFEFERAWEITLRYLPPDPRRDFGIRGPWFPEGTTQAWRAEREHLAWFRGVCEQAWDGGPSRLRLLRSESGLAGVLGDGRAGRGRSRHLSEAA